MEILHCVMQSVMPYHEGWEHACNPNEESTTSVTTRWPAMYVTSIIVARMRILQGVLQGVMSYHMNDKHACNPNGDPKQVLQSVMPYSVCYKRACNSNEYPIMRVTKRDAPQNVLQASL
eukprot:590644-Pleurochrysis_carterae.AAC.1